MKKIFSFITALMVATTMFAQDALFTQTYPGSPSSYVGAYTASFTVTTGDYTLTYANINNGQAKDGWDVIRAGRKNVASVATITSGQLSEAISKVAINFTEVNASLTNSLKLKVADNADFTGATEVGADIVAGLVEFAIETPAADMYYQIEIDQASGSANGFNRFNSVAFYEAEGGEDPGDEPAENVLTGELNGTDATYSFTYEFATTEDMQLEVTGLLEITGEVVGMVPQIFINNAYAGNFTYDAGVCSFTSADAYEAGAELDIYFYFAYAGGATATDHVAYTIETPAVEPVAYYIKNNWDGVSDWTWQTMTEESEGVWVYEGVFGGTGVNINTKAEDDGNADWFAIDDITCEGTLAAGQTVKFTYNVAAATLAAEIQDVPVVVTYYIKSKWAEDATDWTWQPMTEESEGVWVYDGTFYGTGVNINTAASDNGAVWYPLGSEYEGHQLDGDIEVGQNVHFVYNVEAATVTATAIVEPVVELNTCAEVNAAAANTEIALGEVQVVYVNGSYVYVKDATGITLLYKANLGLTVGQVVEGIEGKVSIYKGLPELVPSNALADWTVREPLDGEEITFEAWTVETAPTVADNINQIYFFANVPYNNGAVFSDATITVYNKFNIEPAFEDEHVYNFVGAISTYNGIQILPLVAEDVTPDTPVEFSHELYGSEELPAIGKTWFANTGWTEETNSHAEIVNDYDVNIVLVDAKAGQWQSQIFVNPGFTWEVGAYYKMEFDLTTNHQLGGVTVKVNNNDNNVFYYSYPNDNIFLADQTTHFVADSIYAMAEPTDGGQLIFSIGWCDANTEILISNIVITKYEAPVVPQDIEITVSSLTNPGALIWTDATATDGWWQIYGRMAQYGFSLSNMGGVTEAAGTYTMDDLDADFSYVNIYGDTDTVKVAFVDASITIAVADGIVTVNATLVGDDGNNYIFNLTYKDPTAENTVNLVMPNWQLDDTYLEAAGLFGLMSESADGNYVQLYIWSKTVAGDYTDADLDNQYFGSGLVVGEEAPAIFSATIKVEEGANGVVTVTADLLCYNNTLYKVTTQVPETALENIELVEKATKVVSDGQVLIIRDAKMFNVLGARIR